MARIQCALGALSIYHMLALAYLWQTGMIGVAGSRFSLTDHLSEGSSTKNSSDVCW